MIKITYHRRLNSLEMHGHAGGKRGNDLVCAAASMLANTLALNVERLKCQGAAAHVEITLEPGNAAIWCRPKSKMESVVTLCMDSVCMGFELLHKEYPKKVQYTVIDL